jgi:hypothetical protein
MRLFRILKYQILFLILFASFAYPQFIKNYEETSKKDLVDALSFAGIDIINLDLEKVDRNYAFKVIVEEYAGKDNLISSNIAISQFTEYRKQTEDGKWEIKYIDSLRLISKVINNSFLFGFSINQKPQWKGKIEEENGVKVIKNPNEPLYGEIEFKLEEDLSIGNEEDENFMFDNFVMPGVDSEGNIYVMDSGNYRIQKFDREGNYLLTIGRRGQGPGEFIQPQKIYLDSDNNLYVSDVGRIQIFDNEGNFKDSFKPLYSLSCRGVTKDENVVIVKYPHPSEHGKTELLILDSKGKLIKNIASFPYQIPYRIKGHSPQNPYTYRLYFCSSNYGIEAYGYSSEYKIFILNASGDLIYKITKDEMPTSITRKEKKEVINRYMEMQKKLQIGPKLKRSEVEKAYKLLKYKPFYTSLIMDDKGCLYVRRFGTEYYDMYDDEGYYLYKVKISVTPRIIMNGYSYKVLRDAGTDYLKLKRYKIKNWDQIMFRFREIRTESSSAEEGELKALIKTQLLLGKKALVNHWS